MNPGGRYQIVPVIDKEPLGIGEGAAACTVPLCGKVTKEVAATAAATTAKSIVFFISVSTTPS